jgi:hypothetical protein
MQDDAMWRSLQGTGREVMWQRVNGTGLERLQLTTTADGFTAVGMLMGIEADKPFVASYSIRGAASWIIKKAVIMVWDDPARNLILHSGNRGEWGIRGTQVSAASDLAGSLDECFDIDIYPSPFTNTLPIRRLQLSPGDSAEITVAFIELPKLALRPTKQRYTCLAADAFGGRYLFEALESGFQAELAVDSARLVVEYPGWFRRIWP